MIDAIFIKIIYVVAPTEHIAAADLQLAAVVSLDQNLITTLNRFTEQYVVIAQQDTRGFRWFLRAGFSSQRNVDDAANQNRGRHDRAVGDKLLHDPRRTTKMPR